MHFAPSKCATALGISGNGMVAIPRALPPKGDQPFLLAETESEAKAKPGGLLGLYVAIP